MKETYKLTTSLGASIIYSLSTSSKESLLSSLEEQYLLKSKNGYTFRPNYTYMNLVQNKSICSHVNKGDFLLGTFHNKAIQVEVSLRLIVTGDNK